MLIQNTPRVAFLAFAAAAFAVAAPSAAKKSSAKAKTAIAEVVSPEEAAPARSDATARVLEWIALSGDNDSLPYIVIDKEAARLFLFDGNGKSLGDAPVLIGLMPGDDATPGVGAKDLAEIGPAEKTTPAGRFLAKYGWAAGNQKVLWVDYATSVALHAVVTTNKKERRLERLESPTVEDNRISFGCINVPTEFYKEGVRPLFEKKGGLVYVLPDTKPLEEVFPRVRMLPFLKN